MKIYLKQSKNNGKCPWNTNNPDKAAEIFPDGLCPILYHTLYPYFLGASFGAKFGYNEQNDCQVCCPAEKGIDLIVKVRSYQERFKNIVPEDWRDVIHAEVIRSHGDCVYKYNAGQVFFFPTFNKANTVCPTGIFNLFPFMNLERPACINIKKLRCPDWNENVTLSVHIGDDSDFMG